MKKKEYLSWKEDCSAIIQVYLKNCESISDDALVSFLHSYAILLPLLNQYSKELNIDMNELYQSTLSLYINTQKTTKINQLFYQFILQPCLFQQNHHSYYIQLVHQLLKEIRKNNYKDYYEFVKYFVVCLKASPETCHEYTEILLDILLYIEKDEYNHVLHVNENDSVRYMILLWIHELSLDSQTLSKEPIQLCINSLIKSLLVMNFEELWRIMYSSIR